MATQLQPPGGMPDPVAVSETMETGESCVDISQSHEETSEEISWIPCNNMNWAFVPRPILPPKEEYDPVEKFVFDAIRSRSAKDINELDPEHHKSSILGYKAILELLRKRDDESMLRKVLLALRTSGDGTTMGMIIRDSKRHSNLLHLLFRMDLFSFDQKATDGGAKTQRNPFDSILADAYLNLVVALVSANSVFLTPAINMLWRCIQKTDAITTEDRQLILYKSVETKEESEVMIDQQFQKNSRLHGALSKILHLVPKGHSEIFPVIASDFPFKLAALHKQACYVKHCFIVLNYVPNIRQKILELCVDKCLEIDVEIRIAQDGNVLIEGATNDDEDTAEVHSRMDEEIQETKPVMKEIEEKKDQLKKNKRSTADQVDEMAEKVSFYDYWTINNTFHPTAVFHNSLDFQLDTLMYLVFNHLTTSTGIKTPRELYKMIVSAFDSVILTTHRSKFVQFFILFLCGIDYDSKYHEEMKDTDEDGQTDQSMLSREFSAKLINLVLDPFLPSINRQSAACYLASFVSRSTSVCAGTACEAVSAILRFTEAYMDTYHTAALARNARRGTGMEFGTGNQTSKIALHSLFYTVCQAAFYIMCFRGRECIEYHKKAVEYHAQLDHDDEDDDHILLYPDPMLIDISLKRWTRLVSHHLHPLKYCLESVRGEFLLLSDRFDLIEGETLNRLIIEDRKMASNPQPNGPNGLMAKKASSIRTAATLEKKRMTGGVGGLGRGSNPLDSFFPFDPYLLRRSYSFVDPYYRHWTGSLNEDDLELDSDHEEPTNFVDDEVSIGDDDDDDDDDDDHDDIASDDSSEEDDDSVENEHSLVEFNACAAMSNTSTTCSVEDNASDNEITAADMAVPKETWVTKLKRARALSLEDCW